MSNKLFVGFKNTIFENLPNRNFLLLHDSIPEMHDRSRPQIFDPFRHSFNPLAGMNDKRARELAVVLYTLYPQADTTLTVRDGKRSLFKALKQAKSFEELDGDEEVIALKDDLLGSTFMRDVLCRPKNNTQLKPNSVVLAHIDRKQMSEFDALALGFLLINAYQGQLIIPDLNFYGRDIHRSLVREDRLIAGVHSLQELPEKLRNAVLRITDTECNRTLYDDAVVLAKYAHHLPGTNGFNDFVSDAIGTPIVR
jgi:hypothetical protein